jgi:phenylacetic acid degradation operon negative regulatory protein
MAVTTEMTKQPTSITDLGSRAFVTGMLSPDGTIVADELYTVGERLGFTTHQIRLVLARLVDEGTFTQDGRGRKAVLRTTDRYTALVEPEHEWLRMAYRQDAGEAPWDGRWTLVAFSLDEECRTARNALRELLQAMSAAQIAGGLYVHANDVSVEVSGAVNALGVAGGVMVAHTTDLVVGGRSRPTSVAARLWPLGELAGGYREFLATYGPRVRRRMTSDPVEELVTGFELVAAFVAAAPSTRSCLRSSCLLAGRAPAPARRCGGSAAGSPRRGRLLVYRRCSPASTICSTTCTEPV